MTTRKTPTAQKLSAAQFITLVTIIAQGDTATLHSGQRYFKVNSAISMLRKGLVENANPGMSDTPSDWRPGCRLRASDTGLAAYRAHLANL